MRTQIFAYKGFIGILSNSNSEGIINDPILQDSRGFSVDVKGIDISKEALGLLKKMKGHAGKDGELDIFKTADNIIIFSWLGGEYKIIDPKKSSFSLENDSSLFTPLDEGPEPPEEFINFINSL
jgi:hypothetical protein